MNASYHPAPTLEERTEENELLGIRGREASAPAQTLITHAEPDEDTLLDFSAGDMLVPGGLSQLVVLHDAQGSIPRNYKDFLYGISLLADMSICAVYACIGYAVYALK